MTDRVSVYWHCHLCDKRPGRPALISAHLRARWQLGSCARTIGAANNPALRHGSPRDPSARWAFWGEGRGGEETEGHRNRPGNDGQTRRGGESRVLRGNGTRSSPTPNGLPAEGRPQPRGAWGSNLVCGSRRPIQAVCHPPASPHAARLLLPVCLLPRPLPGRQWGCE